jgi:hypothetical protein
VGEWVGGWVGGYKRGFYISFNEQQDRFQGLLRENFSLVSVSMILLFDL